MLQLVQNLTGKAVVYIVNGQTVIDNQLPNYIQEAFTSFKNSDKKEDFVKIGESVYFFVKEDEDLEKMRVFGFNIRQKLDKKANTITIAGNGETTLALAEGLALSNYQLLKYYKDADDREYALEHIYVFCDISESRISPMNNTVKAVCWARDMRNEPVNYLDAIQLGKDIIEIGNEAGFTVEV